MRAPGSYPLEVDMHISDLLRAGAGLNAAAYAVEAELTRYIIDETGERRTKLIPVDLAAVLNGDATADLKLESYDYLSVMAVPDWGDMFDIEIVGEVRFPGRYPVRHGETLLSVVERAGGLTDLAFTPGAVFTRGSLREREEDQLKLLVRRLESDIASLQLRTAADPSSDAQQAVSAGEALLSRARSTEATGRLVIDLDKVIAAEPGGDSDIDLRKGDKLYIPRRALEVTVLGEVQYTTSHLYDTKRSRDGYINLSGGLTLNGDKKRIYVVRANGAVQGSKGSRWFGGADAKIYPGDTIVVPADTDRTPKLVQWTSITQVLYQMAIAVAAVNSF
jgi:protein involved in polysaccharide export with SLBB domain